MTSNQVSYEVGMSNFYESARHNNVSEIQQSRALDLQEQLNKWQNEWNTAKNNIQASYNDAYIKWLNADLDWKKVYEEELANIKQQEADTDAYYKYMMTDIQNELAGIQHAQASETARHNEEVEKLQNTANWLTSKQVEYQQSAAMLNAEVQNYKISTDQLIAQMNNATKLDVANLEASYQLAMAKLEEQRLKIQQEQTDISRERSQYQNAADWIKSVGTFAGLILAQFNH